MKPEPQVIFFTPYPQDNLSTFRTTGPSKRAGGGGMSSLYVKRGPVFQCCGIS